MTSECSIDRVLAIDDEAGLLSIVREAALGVGFEVRTTTEAACFLRLAREWKPTLILMDLQMPDVDGVELLRRMAGDNLTVPIVLMSGVDDKLLRVVSDLGTELGLNMRGALTKPLRLEAFKRTLTGHIAPTHGTLLDELSAAIEANELILHYQPIVDLADRSLVGVEALVRWNHAARGLLPPDHFVPFAETNGLIDALTTFVLREAIQQAARWAARSRPLSIAINISALNLADADFPNRVEALCREHGVPPERICLELTETATARDAMTLKTILSRLRLKGFQLAIDDFGMGYSSMMQLRSLPFTKLKIDKSFVADMLHSEDSSIIVDAIIALAGAFRMAVVAEGVETQAQSAALARRGCTMAQGYFFARPQPADAI